METSVRYLEFAVRCNRLAKRLSWPRRKRTARPWKKCPRLGRSLPERPTEKERSRERPDAPSPNSLDVGFVSVDPTGPCRCEKKSDRPLATKLAAMLEAGAGWSGGTQVSSSAMFP